MPYIRCDINCDPLPDEEQDELHYDVGPQKESCLVYENYNLKYTRCDIDCVEVTGDDIPDIYEGWNGDYVKVKVDGSKTFGVSKKLVLQTIYEPKDMFGEDLPIDCFNEPPSVVTDITNLVSLNYVTPATYEDEIYLASEEGADYFFELQSNRTRLLIEDNTRVNPLYLVSS